MEGSEFLLASSSQEVKHPKLLFSPFSWTLKYRDLSKDIESKSESGLFILKLQIP